MNVIRKLKLVENDGWRGLGIEWLKTAAKEAREAIEGERERCANIALAIDSGRGNEKEIARAIRDSGDTA